jgi:hypothetical protein
VAAGCAATLALTRLIAGMLYGVKPADPLNLLGLPSFCLRRRLPPGWAPGRRPLAYRRAPLEYPWSPDDVQQVPEDQVTRGVGH